MADTTDHGKSQPPSGWTDVFTRISSNIANWYQQHSPLNGMKRLTNRIANFGRRLLNRPELVRSTSGEREPQSPQGNRRAPNHAHDQRSMQGPSQGRHSSWSQPAQYRRQPPFTSSNPRFSTFDPTELEMVVHDSEEPPGLSHQGSYWLNSNYLGPGPTGPTTPAQRRVEEYIAQTPVGQLRETLRDQHLSRVNESANALLDIATTANPKLADYVNKARQTYPQDPAAALDHLSDSVIGKDSKALMDAWRDRIVSDPSSGGPMRHINSVLRPSSQTSSRPCSIATRGALLGAMCMTASPEHMTKTEAGMSEIGKSAHRLFRVAKANPQLNNETIAALEANPNDPVAALNDLTARLVKDNRAHVLAESWGGALVHNANGLRQDVNNFLDSSGCSPLTDKTLQTARGIGGDLFHGHIESIRPPKAPDGPTGSLYLE